MTITQEQATWFAQTFGQIADNVERAVLGKRHVVELVLTAMLSDGHVLLEDVPGTGKTSLARAIGAVGAGHEHAHPVHPRPAARRHHRHHGVRPEDGRLRVPRRPDLRQHRARRRDQPREPEDPVRAARGDGGGQGHDRRRLAAGRRAVPRARHAEPGRAGRHLPAARGAARPVHDARVARLPRPRRDRPHPRRRGRAPPPTSPDHHPAGARRHGRPRGGRSTSTRSSSTTSRGSSTAPARPTRCAWASASAARSR